MRSAVYSLFTTLLLLVPISAVPLMAIFGVPQFTPVVASPLDEPADDDWAGSARRKAKPAAKSPRTDDAEIDLTLEETPNWDEATAERPRAFRKPKRSSDSTIGKELSEDRESEFAETDRPVAKKRRSIAPLDEPDDFPIQKAGHETVKGRLLEDDSAEAAAGIQDLFGSDGLPDGGKVPAVKPGYRRQRTKSPDEADGPSDRNSARNKRQSPPPEPLTWTKAVRRLNELGIRNFRLEPGVRPGEFLFACSYTPSNSPHVTRRFEAEADDPLKAVAKVLAQVEEAAQQQLLAAPRRTIDTADRRSRE